MPPALYNCKTGERYASHDEMCKERRHRDNMGQKLRYWRNRYGYDLSKNDYEEFNKHIDTIKNIYHIHDFMCKFDKNNISGDELEIYVKNHKSINNALPIQSYLKTLKPIDTKNPLVEFDSSPLVVTF
jgi:hypothetical protein